MALVQKLNLRVKEGCSAQVFLEQLSLAEDCVHLGDKEVLDGVAEGCEELALGGMIPSRTVETSFCDSQRDLASSEACRTPSREHVHQDLLQSVRGLGAGVIAHRLHVSYLLSSPVSVDTAGCDIPGPGLFKGASLCASSVLGLLLGAMLRAWILAGRACLNILLLILDNHVVVVIVQLQINFIVFVVCVLGFGGLAGLQALRRRMGGGSALRSGGRGGLVQRLAQTAQKWGRLHSLGADQGFSHVFVVHLMSRS